MVSVLDLACINTHGGVRVAVPDSLKLITPYVLREQEQWFEIETEFVRTFMQAGMNVIDIGANYGVYTLLMAKVIGNAGYVWAFEPASSTAGCLSKSIALNQLANVSLIQSALSDHAGTAFLEITEHAELNALVADTAATREAVSLTTLDACMHQYRWSDIDFIKIDAEGEESNIVRGGRAFFAEHSPLVMFELKHDRVVNVALIRQFTELGYGVYRLLPGLNLLVPFDPTEAIDSFQLNLFACKQDRARRLQHNDLLAMQLESLEQLQQTYASRWFDTLFERPYARRIWGRRENLDQRIAQPDAREYMQALEYYFLAHAIESSPGQRYSALRHAYRTLNSATENRHRPARLCTLSRIACELGWREVEICLLQQLVQIIRTARRLQLDEPLLPVCRRYDDIDPGSRPAQWLASSVLEQWEIQQRYSSFYIPSRDTTMYTLELLEYIGNSGFQSAEMERRRQLLRIRFGMQGGPEPAPLLIAKTADNLNPAYWKGS